MPWRECSAMEERLRFVARLIEGEAMTDLCLELGISRKTGYKLFNRYKEEGAAAFTDRSRRPVRLLERAKGFEPSTPTLARLCSTPELRPRPRSGALSKRPVGRLQADPPGRRQPWTAAASSGMVPPAPALVSRGRRNIYAPT